VAEFPDGKSSLNSRESVEPLLVVVVVIAVELVLAGAGVCGRCSRAFELIEAGVQKLFTPGVVETVALPANSKLRMPR